VGGGGGHPISPLPHRAGGGNGICWSDAGGGKVLRGRKGGEVYFYLNLEEYTYSCE
jgi:hypothetical protein